MVTLASFAPSPRLKPRAVYGGDFQKNVIISFSVTMIALRMSSIDEMSLSFDTNTLPTA